MVTGGVVWNQGCHKVGSEDDNVQPAEESVRISGTRTRWIVPRRSSPSCSIMVKKAWVYVHAGHDKWRNRKMTVMVRAKSFVDGFSALTKLEGKQFEEREKEEKAKRSEVVRGRRSGGTWMKSVRA